MKIEAGDLGPSQLNCFELFRFTEVPVLRGSTVHVPLTITETDQLWHALSTTNFFRF